MSGAKRGRILFVIDDQVSRDRLRIMTRIVDKIRQTFDVQVLKPQEEVALVEALKAEEKAQLLILPWKAYLKMRKVDGHFGLNRVQGPNVIGYIADTESYERLGPAPGRNQAIIIDFAHLMPIEAFSLIQSMVPDRGRLGLKPLVSDQTKIYTESWLAGQGGGKRIDALLSLPEIKEHEWTPRTQSIQVLLSALWTLVYVEGPGKIQVSTDPKKEAPKAYFQFAADNNALLFRLVYHFHLNPKETVQAFWPDSEEEKKNSPAVQALLKYADFIRVHPMHKTSDIEITIGLFKSAPSQTYPNHPRSLWIEPLSPSICDEPPYLLPNKDEPRLAPMPDTGVFMQQPQGKTAADENLRLKDKYIVDLSHKLKDLKKQLDEKNEKIKEMRSGGISTAAPLPPPDPENLLEALQTRFFEAQYEMRQIETQVQTAETKGASETQIKHLRAKIQILEQKERAWLELIGKTVKRIREARLKASGD